jgi:hypothetical protein
VLTRTIGGSAVRAVALEEDWIAAAPAEDTVKLLDKGYRLT